MNRVRAKPLPGYLKSIAIKILGMINILQHRFCEAKPSSENIYIYKGLQALIDELSMPLGIDI